MDTKAKDHSEELIEIAEVLRVGDAFGLDNEEALEGMNDFLNFFPLVGVMLDIEDICVEDLIDFLVFLNENEE